MSSFETQRLSMSQAFDLVPENGCIVLRAPIAECQAEADRRNMRTRREWWSITAVEVRNTLQVLISHKRLI